MSAFDPESQVPTERITLTCSHCGSLITLVLAPKYRTYEDEAAYWHKVADYYANKLHEIEAVVGVRAGTFTKID